MEEFEKLIAKLIKVEALRDGGATHGERAAAANAHRNLLRRLEELKGVDPPVEYRFSLENQWSHRLFLAVCRHFGLKPFRYKRQRYTTVMLRVPTTFVDEVLWPMFEEYDQILTGHMEEITTRVIAQVFEQDDDGIDILPG